MSKFFLQYKDFQDDLTKNKIDDTVAVFHGFITALLAKGVDDNDRVIKDLIKSVLNYDSPLPGSVIAHITNYIIKSAKAIKNKTYHDMLPGKDDDHVLSLEYLAQFGYGLTLGLLHMPGEGGKISNHDKDSFDLFSFMAELDADSEFDTQSYIDVIEGICQAIYALKGR